MRNAYDKATTLKPSNAQTTPNRTYKVYSLPKTAKPRTEITQAEIVKSSANISSTPSEDKTAIPLPVSSVVVVVGLDGCSNGEVGGASTNGDCGSSSTLSDLTKIQSHPGQPEGKNVKSISMRHQNIRFSRNNSRGKNTGQKKRDSKRTGSYRLWRNHYLYGTERSEATRDNTSCGTHHHPRLDWRGDATCITQP